MSNEIEISIYDSVEIELTEIGKDTYINYYKEALNNNSSNRYLIHIIKEVENNNTVKLDFADFMLIFGSKMVAGNNHQFKDGKFKIIKRC